MLNVAEDLKSQGTMDEKVEVEYEEEEQVTQGIASSRVVVPFPMATSFCHSTFTYPSFTPSSSTSLGICSEAHLSDGVYKQ